MSDTDLFEKTGWIDSAVCANSIFDPDMWFPSEDQGQGVSPLGLGGRYAMQMCASCPVIVECGKYILQREWVLGRYQRFGIQAGMTPVFRWKLTCKLKEYFRENNIEMKFVHVPFSPHLTGAPGVDNIRPPYRKREQGVTA